MKKILLLITLTILLITSCNMDATSGIFQSAMNSQTLVTEPVEQIIKFDEENNTIYFTSSKGIFKFDNSGYSSVFLNNGSVRVNEAIILDGHIFFTNDKNGTISLNKRDKDSGELSTVTIENFKLENGNTISIQKDTIYLIDKANKTISKAEYADGKFTAVEFLNFADQVKDSKNVGVEIYDNYINIIYYNDGETPKYLNYLYDGAKAYLATDKDGKNYTNKITGAYRNADGSFVVTSAKDGITIDFFKADEAKENYAKEDGKTISTNLNFADPDIALGKFKDHYFFHPSRSQQVYYFKDGDKSISTTSFNNFSSQIDFVSVIESSKFVDYVLVATSQNGFYKLTSLDSSTGFYRINSL